MLGCEPARHTNKAILVTKYPLTALLHKLEASVNVTGDAGPSSLKALWPEDRRVCVA